ncbi:hypothetical protein CH305_18590 [Rhodococcus sp. 15-649-2-2]|uniref:DUF6221 family protein n=1 Tax=Rhodococcus sp. 15-649-2-2 TaxID=2023140 RepID=UPI000B9A21F9|nr:DUF6221 family protein [Rhodococcus sp. 15-649-2-2]OZE77245.1 hypothetical protein CH305_18590 [Rhodococcus sp. 15-649-2-2]
MGVVEFLLARIDEDEQVASAIDSKQLDSGWSTSYNQFGLANTPPGWYITPHIGLAYEEEGARHIARFNPERVLREVTAKRALIKSTIKRIEEGWGYHGNEGIVCADLRPMAEVYSDHPDFASIVWE